MYKVRYILLILILPLLSSFYAYSQTPPYDSTYLKSVQDSVDLYYRYHPWEKKKKQQTEFQVLPYYGLSYTQEIQFSATLGAIMLYKPKDDTKAHYSAAGFIGSISNTLAFSTTIFGIHHFTGTKLSLKYKVLYDQMPKKFWGIGYENASQNQNLGTYEEQKVLGNIGLNYSFSNCAVGATLGYTYFNSRKFSDSTFTQNYRLNSWAPNIGIHFILDTKDQKNSPEKGLFLELRQTFFPGFLSSNRPYYRTSVTFDFYQKAWWGAVFALDIFSESNYGDTPWNEYYQMGGDIRMRGYYLGRYRDRNIIAAQLELRQKVYKGHSIAVWGGAGNIFPAYSDFNIKNTLPTYGAGYRFKFYSLVLRADFGFGVNGQYSISVGINEAF